MINELLFGVGLFGISGVSLLCPTLAAVLKVFQKKGGIVPNSPSAGASSLAIVIPAHNEAAHIGSTLTSIETSIRNLEQSLSGAPFTIRVLVGLDGCTDQTAEVVRSFSRVEAREFAQNQGKWRTIESLLSGIATEWTILADSGIQWSESWLVEFMNTAQANPKALAIAPSYKPLRSGLLSRWVWGIEVFLKTCEGWSGGPVSLHGATLGYKTSALKMALRRLAGNAWLNDDVVIPLMVRTLNPQGLVLYPIGQVQDAAVRQQEVDMGRRRRMVKGNLQWIRALWPMALRLNPVVGVLATRRVFRMLWAYWFIFLGAGVLLTFRPLILPAFAGVVMALIISGSIRQLAGAAMVSLLSPWYLIRTPRLSEGAWS